MKNKTLDEERYLWRKVQVVLGCKVTPSYRKLLLELYGWERVEAALADLPAYMARLEFGMTPKATMFEQVIKQFGTASVEFPAAVVEASEDPLPPPDTGEPTVWWFEGRPELPNLIRAIMETNLSGTDWCEDFSLAGALALVGAAIGNRLRFYSWNVYGYPNEYWMLAGSTGSSFKTYQIASIYQLMSETNPGLLAPDAGSWQGLMKHLSVAPSALWCIDEWSGLLSEIKTQDYQKRMREILQTLFHHGGVFKRQLSKDAYESDNPALTILTSIQPEIFGLEMLGRREVESGLVNRFLLIVADMPEESWPRLDWDVRLTQRNRCVRKLRELSQASSTVFADPVQDLVSVWRGRWREFFGEDGEIVAKRSAIHALKIACILWAADVGMPPNRTMIPEKYARMAIDILENWFDRASAFVAEVRVKVPGELFRREIMEYVRNHNGTEASFKDILHQTKLSKRECEGHLETLVAREALGQRTAEDGRETYFVPA